MMHFENARLTYSVLLVRTVGLHMARLRSVASTLPFCNIWSCLQLPPPPPPPPFHNLCLRKAIVLHYLRSYFIIDIVSLLPLGEWRLPRVVLRGLCVLAKSWLRRTVPDLVIQGNNSAKLARLTRIIRLLRLLRLVKLLK